jgi:hypothetical protein
MKIIIISFFIFTLSITQSFGQGPGEYLLKADSCYEAGNQEAAKALYLNAAQQGSAEAHFALAYKYDLPPDEHLYHYIEAAKKGHAEALGYALDLLLFRANSLRIADPQKALDLYYQAKKANPGLSLYDEENVVKIMKMCAEPKGFDTEKFMKKYGIEDEDGYSTWELAEEASRGGRFGKPDPALVFNLVIRGGVVPAELMLAVEEVYSNWKNGIVKEFNICDYVTSGLGQTYCASIASSKADSIRQQKISLLKQKLGGVAEQLLDKAFTAAFEFIELKVTTEAGHEGTGLAAVILSSEREQKDQFVEWIEKIQSGFVPSPGNPLVKADQKLNETYRKVLRQIQANAEEVNYPFTQDDIKTVQRLWIPYRDVSVNLFVHINPAIDKNIWLSWLTEIRVKELQSILATEY